MALQTVVALLQASRSVSDSTRKPAEQQIMQYFDQPGFGMFLCVRCSAKFKRQSSKTFSMPKISIALVSDLPSSKELVAEILIFGYNRA
jgi:hypothetical protein